MFKRCRCCALSGSNRPPAGQGFDDVVFAQERDDLVDQAKQEYDTTTCLGKARLWGNRSCWPSPTPPPQGWAEGRARRNGRAPPAERREGGGRGGGAAGRPGPPAAARPTSPPRGARPRGAAPVTTQTTDLLVCEGPAAGGKYAGFERAGGRVVEMPSQDELRAALDDGVRRWSLGISPTDFLVPVCHQGMNRSQIMRRALSELQGGFAAGQGRGRWVSRPHGASSGCDAHTAFENLDDTNFFGYLHDAGDIFARGYNSAVDPDPQQGPLQRAFEATFRDTKSPRLGEEMAADQWQLNPSGDGQVSLVRLEQSRTQSHRWFDRWVFGSIPAIQEAAQLDPGSAAAGAVPPQHCTRRIFLCFARAVPIVINRLLEAGGAETSVVVALELDDSINHELRQCSGQSEAETKRALVGAHRRALALYKSFLHVVEAPSTSAPRHHPVRSPEAIPPKKVRSPSYFALIRHSERLDGLDPAAQDSTVAREGARSAWGKADRVARPYDPPIIDWQLPATQAEALKRFGVTRLVVSPFRRCLQTAAVLASSLGVSEVQVHRGLGEAMAMVQRCGWPSPDHELTYLNEQEMVAILAEAGVSLAPQIRGSTPRLGDDDAARIRSVLQDLHLEAARHQGGTLCVTHGDLVGQWWEQCTRETVLEIENCGWAVFEDMAPVDSWGISAMRLD